MAIVDEVLRYAAKGWRVFPCRPKGKEPMTPSGFQAATTDNEKIRYWWKSYPDTNIGLATGNGLYVLDIDGPEGELSLQDKKIPEGPQVKTGKGRHCYFRTDEPLRSFVGRLPHVDGRGEGGYVIAPPSIHPSGAEYQWVEGTEDLPLPECPVWLADLAKQKATPAPSPRTGGEGQAILAGQRNASLTSLAGTMRKRGMSAEAIGAALLEENRNRCDPPLPEDEVRRIAASVARYAPGGEDDADLRAKAARAGVSIEQARLLLQSAEDVDPLQRLSAVFRVPVAEVLLEVQGESRNFRLVLEGGRTVPLGSGEDLHTLRKVRGRLLDHERVTLDCKPKEWPEVLGILAEAAREVSLPDPDREAVLGCILEIDLFSPEIKGEGEHPESINTEDIDAESYDDGIHYEFDECCFRTPDGLLWFRFEELMAKILRTQIKLTRRQVTSYLRAWGFVQKEVWGKARGYKRVPKRTHIRFWAGRVPNE